jgi:hypothetical protein
MTNGNTDCTEKLFFLKYYSSYLTFPASGNIKLLFGRQGCFQMRHRKVISAVLLIQQTTSSNFSLTSVAHFPWSTKITHVCRSFI